MALFVVHFAKNASLSSNTNRSLSIANVSPGGSSTALISIVPISGLDPNGTAYRVTVFVSVDTLQKSIVVTACCPTARKMFVGIVCICVF
jgi:hypothetical protein